MNDLGKIQVKRGLSANLPILGIGEPGFTTDTKRFYIGDGTRNIEFSQTNHNHTQYAPLISPQFSGTPKAPVSATDYTTYRIRNMALMSSAPSGAIGNGQLVGVYE